MEQYEGFSPEDGHQEEAGIVEHVSIDWGATMSYLSALFSGNPPEEEVRALTESLTEMYPSDAEAITALAELPSYFALERDVEDSRRQEALGVVAKEDLKTLRKERMRMILEMTQYQFLLTSLVTRFANDERYLRGFWRSTEELALLDHSSGAMEKTKEAVLSQAAIFLLLKQLGKHPVLSHPKEDAYNAIDIWTDDHRAIQVKGAPRSEHFAVIATEEDIVFPGVSVSQEGKDRHYNSFIAHEHAYLKAKLNRYNAATHQQVEGFLMVIPRGRRDATTGTPDSALLAEAQIYFRDGAEA